MELTTFEMQWFTLLSNSFFSSAQASKIFCRFRDNIVVKFKCNSLCCFIADLDIKENFRSGHLLFSFNLFIIIKAQKRSLILESIVRNLFI